MNFWDKLFKKKSKLEVNLPPSDFRNWVKLAIGLIGDELVDLEDEEIKDFLVSNDIPEEEAIEIILFLPVAFTRRLLPDLPWKDTYVEWYSITKKKTYRYVDNSRYCIMKEEVDVYWKSNPNNNVILNIAARSSAMGALNKLLHSGSKLEDLEISEDQIIR